MVEITYQMVLSTLQKIALIVGIVYYIVTMRNQTKTRQAQLFMQVYQQYTDRDWLRQQQETQWLWEEYDSFDEYMEKYGPLTNMEGYLTMNTRNNFYEGLGVLVKQGLIDPTMVDDLLSGPIVLFWERRVAPMIDELQEMYNNPASYEWVEYLYKEIKRIRDLEHPEVAGTVRGTASARGATNDLSPARTTTRERLHSEKPDMHTAESLFCVYNYSKNLLKSLYDDSERF